MTERAREVASELIGERHKTHGSWVMTSHAATNLKHVLHGELAMAEKRLAPHQAEALDMIIAKIARIVAGDPNHPDHWRDIAGYALLGCGDAQ